MQRKAHRCCAHGNLGARVICPLTVAALARREDRVADRFAADHGLAQPLAAALRTLQGDHRPASCWTRLFASHPEIDRRMDALRARRSPG
jgi:Zn-dependent protease with chaperone function